MFTVAHIADIHGDDKYFDEVFNGCEFILNTLSKPGENPNLIIIAGDIFDDREIKADSKAFKYLLEWITDLSMISPVAIITGTPKHDGKISDVFNYDGVGMPGHSIIARSLPGQFCLYNDNFFEADNFQGEPEAIISFVPTPTKQYMQGTNEEIATAMNGLFAGFGVTASNYKCPHIINGHFSARGVVISDTQTMVGRDIEISKDQLKMAHYDLCCLGHIHLAQDMGDNIFYSGDIFQKNFGEAGQKKGFYIHSLQEPRQSLEPIFHRYEVESEFIETPTRNLVNIKKDFTTEDIPDLEALPAVLTEEIKGSHIKVSLSAFQDESAKLDREAIIDFYKAAGAVDVRVDIAHIPREIVRSENILDLNHLNEKIAENARIKEEEVPEGVLQIAWDLENLNREEVLEKVTDGYYKRADPRDPAA